MFTYHAYGLTIGSELRLPGLVAAEREAQPEIRIQCRSKPPEGWPIRSDNGKRLTGIAKGVMSFLVRDGIEIIVDVRENADIDYARAIVSGELLSALLRQRGLLTLHASCVAKDGAAIGFVGYSGWGKSTLAMHYVEQDYRLICDDVLAIEFTPEGPMAIPGYPQLKLQSNTAGLYVDDFDGLPLAHSETDKRLHLCTSHFQDSPVPLQRLYLLEGRDRSATRILNLKSMTAVIELSAHTRAANLLRHAAFRRAHLRQVTDLVASMPVKLLQRRLSLEALSDVLTAINQDRNESVEHEKTSTKIPVAATL